ncbi:MAG: ATP-dependent DNA helicase RecQ [Bacteroidota bacterium]
MKSIHEILHEVWGYPSFRKGQEEIIQSVIDGHDTLALLPTGGGKSICFQVPALYLDGLTIVISPLIALMKDQVERLNSLKIPATYLSSSVPQRLIDERLQKAMQGDYKFLYLSPERIQSEMFVQRLKRMPVSLLVIDEAHCVSQWGHDFRPNYLKIPEIREVHPKVPVIALTASAPQKVQEDILQQLALRNPNHFQQSFRRENISYVVLEEENTRTRIKDIIKKLNGSGIVYARTRKAVEHIRDILREAGISTTGYHGGMPHSERDKVQQAWIDNKVQVMVATNAFGMGIDKPDVRFVIHFNLPFDLESYYQEAGRGGRDGQKAYAISFHNPVDIRELRRWQELQFPEWKVLVAHYDYLNKAYQIPPGNYLPKWQVFDIGKLATQQKTSVLSLYASIKILEKEGFLRIKEEKEDYGYLQLTAEPDDIWTFKENHPKLAPLLDHILRTYGGEAYQREVRFLPLGWEHALHLSAEQLQSQLNRLMEYKLLYYQAPFSTPMIRFEQGRQQLLPQNLNWEKYKWLKKRAFSRMSSMISYVQNKAVCRSQLIEKYFDEKGNPPCGICDVCLARKSRSAPEANHDSLQKLILDFISQQKHATYRQVLQSVSSGTQDQREEVLRYLIDKKVVKVSPTGELRMNE